jgi:2-C-methyl-D-erythritol 2,4-cyclodiphosphate synthase
VLIELNIFEASCVAGRFFIFTFSNFQIFKLMRIGFGIDFHQLVAGRDLWIGGVKIPHHKGALGHSDADVLLHAICDALLGALALGDIGVHFPNTDNTWKDIDSKILLQKSYELIKARNYRVINVDSSICLEAPKIKKYSDQMRSVIAGILEITPDDVSVKATTTEKMGFVGREEGLVAYATVLISKFENLKM